MINTFLPTCLNYQKQEQNITCWLSLSPRSQPFAGQWQYITFQNISPFKAVWSWMLQGRPSCARIEVKTTCGISDTESVWLFPCSKIKNWSDMVILKAPCLKATFSFAFGGVWFQTKLLIYCVWHAVYLFYLCHSEEFRFYFPTYGFLLCLMTWWNSGLWLRCSWYLRLLSNQLVNTANHPVVQSSMNTQRLQILNLYTECL